MEINIVAVESEIKPKLNKLIEIATPATKVTIEEIFVEFLELEVGDGAASLDTIKSYLSQIKMYFRWCRNNLVPTLEADSEDIKLYRQYLISEEYSVNTIANKLSIISTLYKAAIAISINSSLFPRHHISFGKHIQMFGNISLS